MARTNLIDSAIAWLHPAAALRRVQARRALAYYEAAKPSRQRKFHLDGKSPNDLVGSSASALRAQARYLERNHDISRGALRTLVHNIIGPGGIGIEPQPRRLDGTIHTEYAAALRDLYQRWRRRPEVTGRMHAAQAERMVCYTWLRDGEAFAQKVIGRKPGLQYSSPLPFLLELLEPDFVPLDYTDTSRSIRQGVQVNSWGRAVAYHVYKGDPREGQAWIAASDLKAVPAEVMIHVSTLDRLHQWRGVSEFASVLTRTEDLKELEEAERVAAKVASSLTAYVKRQAPSDTGYQGPLEDENGKAIPRDLQMHPGMIIDDLAVGEEIGLIDSNRPNPNLVAWRAGQLRAYAAGIGSSYSSIARDYGGSYASMRQELVEQWVNYAVLTDDFAGMYTRPVWSTLVEVADMSGVLRIPPDVMPGTADDCLLVGQSMPWIDPLKEAQAWSLLVQAGFASEVEVIRKRGGNPRDLLDQVQDWRREAAARDLRFSSNAANAPTGGAPAPTQEREEED